MVQKLLEVFKKKNSKKNKKEFRREKVIKLPRATNLFFFKKMA